MSSIFENLGQMAGQAAENFDPLKKMLEDAGLPIAGLNVTNDNGNVTISGSVENGSVAAKAVEMLKGAPGVSSVTNAIQVADVSAQAIKMSVATEHDNLNVRSGPGTEHDIVGKFAKGSVVTVIQKHSDDWYLVEADGVKGYCSTQYLASV